MLTRNVRWSLNLRLIPPTHAILATLFCVVLVGASYSDPSPPIQATKMPSQEIYHIAFDESSSSDGSSDAILADLEADPTTLPGLESSYGFSNPHVVPQTLNARERETGLIGKIVIVLQGRWKEQMVGYRVYRDRSSAQVAYENFSLLNEPELGVHNVDRNNMEVPKDSEMHRYYTGGRCESFVKPNASDQTSARCAALASDRPVIVTALTSQPTSKLVEVTNMIGISPGYFLIGSSGLHALIDAGMRRLHVHASAH